jgi:large subunit ribosomal protein L24
LQSLVLPAAGPARRIGFGAIVQTTLLGFAIGLILALLAALVGPHFVNWNDHRAFFEAEASRLVGVPVRVGGDIDASLLPFPAVTLRELAIGPESEARRLRASSLRIELGLGPLLRGEIRAVEMKLVAPQLRIGLDGQGRVDWPPLTLATETLSIDRLSIENGRATITDAASKTQLVLDQLWFTGDVRSLTGPFRGKGEFVTGGGLFGYEISASGQGPDGIRVRLGLTTDERPLNVELDGMLAFERATPRFDGAITLARPAGAVLANGQTAAYEPWRLTSKVKAGTVSAALEDVSFQYGADERSVSLAGSAQFDFGAKPRLNGRLAARQVDLDRLLATTETPRRLPLAALQAFGEMVGSALRPSWPVTLSIGIDGMVMGGSTLQAVNCDLRSDGAQWNVERLEFRAPGFTQVRVQGQLSPLGKSVGFAGNTTIDSNDPKNLAAWLAGRTAAAAQLKPWHANGAVTMSADRIAVENLQTEFGRGAVEGSVSYSWSVGQRPARLEANLRAAELDLDASFGFGKSALLGLGLEPPGEVALAIEIGRARLAAIDVRSVTARLTFDPNGIAIERLSIADLGNAGIEARGRIETTASLGGDIALDLNARDLDGIIALTERFTPSFAEPLKRLAGLQKTATLHATLGVANSDDGRAHGKLGLAGQIGGVRVNLTARADGKREAFSVTSPGALSETEVRLEGTLEADEAAPLLALAGLNRIPVAEREPARLRLTLQGPASRDLKFEGELSARPIEAKGSGTLRLAADQPAVLDFEKIAGLIGGEAIQGRLALSFGETMQAEGSIETDALDVPATVAAALGLSAQRGAHVNAAGWSTDPMAWEPTGLSGRIEFKTKSAALTPQLVARQLHGVARFGRSGLVFEQVGGELAEGRLDARLAIQNTEQGLSASVRVGLTDAQAAALFTDPTAVSGRVSVQTELQGSGRSPAAFIGSLGGYGTVKLDQAQVSGINPGVFEAVRRAVELGIPTEGSRMREFVAGVLDGAKVPIQHATAVVRVNAGQARFDGIVIGPPGLTAQATVDLASGTLDGRLALTGSAAVTADKVRPTVLVSLKGPVLAPVRTIDASSLANWLTLLRVEQNSKQIDAMERAARETAVPRSLKSPEPPAVEPAAPASPAAAPSSSAEPITAAPAAEQAAAVNQAPALPPPIKVPQAPNARPAPRADNAVPPPTIARPPDLVGAQN